MKDFISKDEWADMHVHTTYSDGLLTPTQVVIKAREAGLKAVGIVDHDTLEGIEEAYLAGKRWGVEIVPGIELSSQCEGKDIHIIGYYCDPTHPKISEYIEKFLKRRYDRAQKIVQILNTMDINITMKDVVSTAKGKCIGRPHIATVLLEKGYVYSFQEAFVKYIGYHSKAYVEKFKISPESAIALVSEAKGLSFIAHPPKNLSMEKLFDFTKAGLDGVEIIHPRLSDRDTRRLQEFVNNYDLLISGGSDCHGRDKKNLSIGRFRIPYSILVKIKKYHALKQKSYILNRYKS
ncbi:MAG: PHP domain-containing protein [bacterium]